MLDHCAVCLSLRHDALCELNVLVQCSHVCETTVVHDAWTRGQEVVVHGWVYGLNNGLIKDLKMSVSSLQQVQTAFEQALNELKQRYAPHVQTHTEPTP